tara:strand:- start:155 stop:541 length:387 start_codon:yes stop_codon:yes gene_type:complete
MANDYNLCNHSYQWVYSYAMINPAEKKIKHLKKVISDPDGYNTNLASKERVESLEEKMSLLHNKIDSIYTLLETLSNRFNTLDYTGEVKYGDLYHASQSSKHISVSLTRKDELESANPYGDDDFATPK